MTTGEAVQHMGDYLGRRVYIEVFGHKKYGTICSVFRHEEKVEVEVEWRDGTMTRRPLSVLKFPGEKKETPSW